MYSTRLELSNFKNSLKSAGSCSFAIVDLPHQLHGAQSRRGRLRPPVGDIIRWGAERFDEHLLTIDAVFAEEIPAHGIDLFTLQPAVGDAASLAGRSAATPQRRQGRCGHR